MTVETRNEFTSLEIILVGIALFACTLLPEVRFLSIVSVAVFVLYLLYLVLHRGELFVKYLAFIFAICANILGCVISEFGQVPLKELMTTSFFVGSLPLLVFSRWLFIAVIILCDDKWSKGIPVLRSEKRVQKQKWIVTASVIILVASLGLFLQVVLKPSFVLGLNSFAYSQMYGVSGLWATLANVLSYLIVIPAMAIRQGNKRLGWSSIICYVLFLLWTGNKFGNFLNVTSILLIVFYDQIMNKGSAFIKKMAVTCLAITVLLVGFSLVAYSFTSNNNPVAYLLERTAQQGQLWWRTYDLYSGGLHVSEFENEVAAIVDQKEGAANNIGSSNGVYGVMYATAPASLIDAKLASGSQYTEAGYAAAFYYFGPIGSCVFSVIMGFFVSLLTNGVLRAIRNGRLIDAAVLARLLVIIQTALSMFVFIGFFDTPSVASYIYLIITQLLLHSNSQVGYRVKKKGLQETSADVMGVYNAR